MCLRGVVQLSSAKHNKAGVYQRSRLESAVTVSAVAVTRVPVET